MRNHANANTKTSWAICARSKQQAKDRNKEGRLPSRPSFGFGGRNRQRRGIARSIAIAVPSAALHVSARAHRHCLGHSFSLRKQRASFSNSLAPAERIGFRQFGLGRCVDSIQLHGGPRARKCYCRIVDAAAVATAARLRGIGSGYSGLRLHPRVWASAAWRVDASCFSSALE